MIVTMEETTLDCSAIYSCIEERWEWVQMTLFKHWQEGMSIWYTGSILPSWAVQRYPKMI